MYRPPIGSTNRVKSIKSKFENASSSPNGPGADPRPPRPDTRQTLARQLSDPCKRNIKRTPAFRLDKNPIVENKLERSALYETKVKQFSALKTTCDAINENAKPLLRKSKSSHDFQLIRSKFDARIPLNPVAVPENQRETVQFEKNVSALYTEPIPKALRPRKTESPPKIDIHHSSTLKLSEFRDNPLTDTLKTALRKPLPSGPAPKKPPRTFQHAATPSKNDSFLHLTKDLKDKLNINGEKTTRKQTDHKYMLNRLETALRNNKLRARREQTPATTSGEDSDDSLLFRSKAQKNDLNAHFSSFNCLQALNCTNNNPYGRIKEPRSEFFVDCKEPVYAEPFNFQAGGVDVERRQITGPNPRSSLYYMSSPVKMEGDGAATVVGQCEIISDKKVNGDVGSVPKSLSIISCELSRDNDDLTTPTPSPTSDTMRIYLDDITKTLSDSDILIRDRNDALNVSESKMNEEKRRVCELIEKFESYVNSVPKYTKPHVHESTLFYGFIIVERIANIIQKKFQFPETASLPANIEVLCFPESEGTSLDSTNNCYSLSLMNGEGERSYGYCRRVIPEGCTKCLPLTYCILSKYKAPRFYQQILLELERRHGIRDVDRNKLIDKFYRCKFPLPGSFVRVDLEKDLQLDRSAWEVVDNNLENGTVDDRIVVPFHYDTMYEDSNLIRLHKLPPSVLRKIFSSLLIERKVILVSSVLSDLSQCMESVQSLLYPFTWCHVFIPILPSNLWEFVESPVPIICGVLSREILKDYKIENGIVVDIDTGEILQSEGDEDKIMSGAMKTAWGQPLKTKKFCNEYNHYACLRQAYLKVFQVCFHNFKNYIINGEFDEKALIDNAATTGTKRFLKLFTQTNTFMAFVDTVVNEPENNTFAVIQHL